MDDDQPHRPDSAPGRTAKGGDHGGYEVVGRAATICAPPGTIETYFSNTTYLNRILGDKLRVEPLAHGGLRWIFDTGSESLSIPTDLVHSSPGEVLTWRSAEGADADVEIKIVFREAPAGRGSEVSALVAYRPEWGALGRLAAWLRGIDPKLQGRLALKRLKMLIETGEIAAGDNRRSG